MKHLIQFFMRRELRPVGFFPDFCLKGYSEVYLPDLDSSVGIKSFSGIGNLEIKGKLLICHSGQVWDIRLTNGSHYSFQEGIGGTIYEQKNNKENEMVNPNIARDVDLCLLASKECKKALNAGSERKAVFGILRSTYDALRTNNGREHLLKLAHLVRRWKT